VIDILAGFEVGRRFAVTQLASLGVGTSRHGGFEVFGHGALIGEHPGVVRYEAIGSGNDWRLAGRQARAGLGGQPRAAGTHLNPVPDRRREVAVSLLPSALMLGGVLLALIPEACFLKDRLAASIRLDLTGDSWSRPVLDREKEFIVS